MNRKLSLLGNGIFLILVIYLDYFNETTSDFIHEYFRFQAIVSFIIFYLTVNLIAVSAKYFYSKKHHIPKNKLNNVHFGIENIADLFLAISFLFLIIRLFGIDPIEVVTSLTIVAAAIVILTKEYIIDFISGIYLSFSHTFEVNDNVKIANMKGKIVEISMMKVKILNEDDDVVILPNSKVYYNEIINYSKRDIQLTTLDFELNLKYVTNIDILEKQLIESLESFKEFIEPNSYILKVVEMHSEHLDLKFSYKLKQADTNIQKQIRKKTLRAVFNNISSNIESHNV